MLTPKQERFVCEYLKDLNATQAAIRAGYSEKSAAQIGAENLRKPAIKEVIDAKLEEMNNSAIVDVAETLEYLTSVMRGEQEDEVLRLSGDGTQSKTDLKVAARDRMRAAELLGKYYGLFVDRTAVTGDMDLSVSIDYGDGDGDGED